VLHDFSTAATEGDRAFGNAADISPLADEQKQVRQVVHRGLLRLRARPT
jgi:hypothetical protein